MNHAATSLAKTLDLEADHISTLIDRVEDVSWVMSVLAVLEAGEAQVKIRAILAGDKLCSWQLWKMVSNGLVSGFGGRTVDAAVASAFALITTWAHGSLNDLGLLVFSWLTFVSDTGDDGTVTDVSLNEPVIITITGYARV